MPPTLPPSLRTALALALVFCASSCRGGGGIDVDLTSFARIPQVEDLDFATIEPAEVWDYWELRRSFGTVPGSILGSGGEVERSELSAGIVAELDVTVPTWGFGPGCLPGGCFEFVAAVRDDSIHIFSSVEALAEFLGTRDVMAEAVLLLDAAGFTWYGEGHGVRYREGGWDAVVFELVEACAPVRTDRLLVRVERTGPLEELAREAWEVTPNACI